jgi:Mn-dependent DtxR family transcriptional regulator
MQRSQRTLTKPDRDPLRLARYYQSLLDSGKFESRAALARYLGVSRARVTQVLSRLSKANTATTEIRQLTTQPDVAAG